MKKIAFVVNSLNAGGIENYLLRYLVFSEGQFSPVVICREGVKGDLLEDYKKIKNIDLHQGCASFLNIIGILKFFRLLLKVKPDAVCDFGGNFAGFSMLFSRFIGVNVRIAFYRGSSDHFKPDYFRNAYNNTMKMLVKFFSTKILSNSTAALTYFFGDNYHSPLFGVLYNGIDSEKFLREKGDLRYILGFKKTDYIVCHVGRFDSSKNHKTILEVAEKLAYTDPDIVFLLCGKGVKEALTNELESIGLSSRVFLMGYTPNVAQVLNSSDCFYFPSITEGQPNALIEAMISGLPVVASNIPSIAEIFPLNYQNKLISPYDVDAAVSQILDLKKNNNLGHSTKLTDLMKRKFDARIQFGLLSDFLSVGER